MEKSQVIEELKALKEAFEEERDAYPICLEEAIRLLEPPDGGDMISRKAAIESIRECAEAAHSMDEWDMEQGYLNAIECIEEEPSAYHEIIHCRGCRWRNDFGHWLGFPVLNVDDDNYCSYAERMESEE